MKNWAVGYLWLGGVFIAIAVLNVTVNWRKEDGRSLGALVLGLVFVYAYKHLKKKRADRKPNGHGEADTR